MKRTFLKLCGLLLGVGIILSGMCAPAYAGELLGAPSWGMKHNNGALITSGADTTVKYEGEASFKVINESPLKANVYGELSKEFPVEKGKTYICSFMAKAQTASGICCCWDWGTRTNLLPFGGTYDWREFSLKYKHEGADGSQTFRMIFENLTKGFWIDNFTIHEEGSDVNLVANGNLEQGFTAVEQKPAEGEVSEEFKESANKIDIHKKHYPLYPIEGIKIDADLSDWEGYPEVYVPTKAEDTVWYIQDQPIDAYFTYKAAQDDTYFYICLDVEDNEHVYDDSASYWTKDSLQLGVSEMDESFGKEIGIVCADDGGKIYNTACDYKIATKREGTHTIYEIALPWERNFDNGVLEGMFSNGRPNQFKSTVIANDSDGNGRIGCTRLSPGMDDTKTSDQYPVFQIVDKKLSWSAFAREQSIDDTTGDVTYELGVWNNSPSKRMTTCKLANGKEVMIEAEPYSIGTASAIINYPKPGKKEELFNFKSNGEELEVKYSLTLLPNKTYTESLIENITERWKELEPLFVKCVAAGKTTDYEMMYYRFIERYIQYMKDDVGQNDFARIQYTYDCLDELLIKAKTNMEAYIAGEKEPRKVPKYVTSPITNDGTIFMAMTDNDGVREQRPVFFNGYIGYSQVPTNMDKFYDIGVNTVQMEIGPWDVVFDSFYWEGYQTVNKDKYGENTGSNYSDLQCVTDQAYDGNYSCRVEYKVPETPNVYRTIAQEINVKPNTTYKYGVYAKGNDTCGLQFCGSDWGDRHDISVDGMDTWTKNEFSFTTGPNETKRTLRFLYNYKGTVYIDGVYCHEDGVEENIVINGDFENAGKPEWYCIKPSGINWYVDMLESAAKNNVAVNVLISPHYFPDFVFKKFPETKMETKGGIGGNTTNFMDEHVRDVMRAYLGELIPRIKDIPSVVTVCLANEPGVELASAAGTMQPYWEEFLKDKFGSVAAMNEAWGTSYGSYAEVDLDAYKGRLQDKSNLTPDFYAYWEFNNIMHNKWFMFLKSIFDELWPEIPLDAKPMWYMSSIDDGNERYRFQLGTNMKWFSQVYDHNGNDAALYSWELRSGQKGPMSKAFFYDYQTSYLDAPVNNSEDHMISDGYTGFSPDERKHCSWDIWNNSFHGRTESQIWSWARDYNRTGVCWLSPMFRPDVQADVADASMDLQRLGWEVKAVVDKEAEIGVFYSDTARFYLPAHLNSVYQAYEGYFFRGHKNDILVEEHLNDISKYKIVVVPNVRNIKKGDLDDLYTYFKNGGHLVFLGKDNLSKDEYDRPLNDPRVAEMLAASYKIDAENNGTSIISPTSTEISKLLGNYAKELGMEQVLIVDAKTGEPVANTEYEWAVYGDDVVINTTFYKFDEKEDIKVYIGGQEIKDLTELRSMENYDGVMTLDAYRPVFIRANGAASLIK